MRSFLRNIVLTLTALVTGSAVGQAESLFGFNTGNMLFRFDTQTNTRTDIGTFSGLLHGETIVGIDYRPATGQVYALGVRPVLDPRFPNLPAGLLGAELHTLNLTNAVLTDIGLVVGGDNIPRLYGNPSQPIRTLDDLTFPSLVSIDFNPASDTLRVAISDNFKDRNTFEVNPDTLQAERSDLLIHNPNEGGGTYPALDAIAYSNNVSNPSSPPILYGYDHLGSLVEVKDLGPDPGFPSHLLEVTTEQTVRLDGQEIHGSFSQYVGFDISGSTGIGYFVAKNTEPAFDPRSLLYTINLTNGSLTQLHTFNKDETVVDITAVPSSVPEPSSIALAGLGGLGLAFGAYRRRKTAAV